MLTPNAQQRWLDRLGPVRTLTPASDAFQRGYEQAVDRVFSDQYRDAKARVSLRLDPNYSGLRAALDEAEDDFFMSRPMAQFYLVLSPKMFKKALERGPHPFAQPRGGATKAAIDAWFEQLMAGGLNTTGRRFERRRSLTTGRPYLVSQDGMILGDATVGRLPAQAVVRALGEGAGVKWMTLDKALGEPWADMDARRPWASARQGLLEQQLEEALARVEAARLALVRASEEDLGATLPAAGAGRPTRPLRI